MKTQTIQKCRTTVALALSIFPVLALLALAVAN